MSVNKDKIVKGVQGAALAMAAAALFSSPALAGGDKHGKSASHEVHCYGVNACKGHNDCKGADNACAGQASCKGTGFVTMSAKACKDVGGKKKDDWRGKVDKADLVKCHGVNACKGHNDCKTAKNACGGHASCKGTGFVKMSAKACKDIGGEVGE
ncbi:hypothetical protein [Gallaecimonas sp. GXIMD4217]|uniref:BufA2 family periplasmic bufferin-type metallophore n=1 Tax=Gallaecimonas sp. GXIMD4217 TaxID=3131927 RepID=UPI00311B04B8